MLAKMRAQKTQRLDWITYNESYDPTYISGPNSKQDSEDGMDWGAIDSLLSRHSRKKTVERPNCYDFSRPNVCSHPDFTSQLELAALFLNLEAFTKLLDAGADPAVVLQDGQHLIVTMAKKMDAGTYQMVMELARRFPTPWPAGVFQALMGTKGVLWNRPLLEIVLRNGAIGGMTRAQQAECFFQAFGRNPNLRLLHEHGLPMNGHLRCDLGAMLAGWPENPRTPGYAFELCPLPLPKRPCDSLYVNLWGASPPTVEKHMVMRNSGGMGQYLVRMRYEVYGMGTDRPYDYISRNMHLARVAAWTSPLLPPEMLLKVFSVVTGMPQRVIDWLWEFGAPGGLAFAVK